MSKFYGYDEAMENDIAKITTPKLALMSDVVASDKKFIRMENGALTVCLLYTSDAADEL